MSRRRNLTQNQVTKLPRKAKRYHLADPVQQGLILRVPPQGPISYVAVARRRGGKQTWASLGTSATLSIDEARALAREAVRKIQAVFHFMSARCPAWPRPLTYGLSSSRRRRLSS
jgi:hypothetical protein